MKIAVCMKQVPAVQEGAMDRETGVLLRAGLEAIVNVYDLGALEAALQLREACGGEVHVFTMGPEKAEAVLREAFARGADEGYLVCDRGFAGADVLATSYTLMQAITSADTYDLILCGRQTTDGDTAQVSGAIAGFLEIPHLNWVTGIERRQEGVLEVSYAMEGRKLRAEVGCPCLLSVEREAFPARMPSLKLKISGKKKEIHRITLAEMPDPDPEHYGLKGSATRVKRVYPPERTAYQQVLTLDPKAAADYMMKILEDSVL